MKKAGTPSRNVFGVLFLVAALLGAAVAPDRAHAQEKPTLTVDDYGQFERLGGATLSPDGRWMAVGISRVNDEGELRVHSTDSDSVVVIPFATRPVFSDDNRWLAYVIGVSPDQRERMREQRQPVRNKLGLLDLQTGEQETLDDIQSFTFSHDGRYLTLRRYRPQEKESSGVDIVVREMATGSTLISFGNVAQMAWQDEGSLLAMTIDADDQVSNGVTLYDPATGRLRTLDTDEATYRHLRWREESGDLVVLKTYEDEQHEDTAHVVLAWRDLDEGDGRSFVLDPREGSERAGHLPGDRVPPPHAGRRTGATIFLGTPGAQAG